MGKVFKGINVANSDKKIDATATSTGADGTGYYRGNDGRFYYGNPQNGYLTETEQSKAYRAREEGVPSQLGSSRPAYNSSTPSSGSGSFLDRVAEFIVCSVLAVKLLFWLLSFLAVFAALSALFFGTLYSWPFFIRLLVLDFANGIVNPGRILIMVVLLALIAYFAFCSYTVFAKRVSRLKQFLIPSAVIAVLLALVSSRGGQNSGDFFVLLIMSFALLALPTLLLCFFEHLITKEQRGDQRWLIIRVAKRIGPFLPGKSTGMIVFGAIIAALGVLFGFIDGVTLFVTVNLVLEGALLAAMGILYKIK